MTPVPKGPSSAWPCSSGPTRPACPLPLGCLPAAAPPASARPLRGQGVTADRVYGADHTLRRWLQDQALGYVLAVTKAQRLGFSRVEDRVTWIPASDWHRLSAGDGAKGPRLYDWAYLPYGGDAAPGWEKGLLIRRSISQPDELAFYLTHATDGTALADLVQVAGTRWAVRRPASRRPRARSASTSTRSAPGPAGTATSRSPCWLTPTSPCCARSPSGDEPTPDLAAELLPLTVPEVRRLLWHLVWPSRPDIAAALAWSRWRRRHQQRARRCHWQRRTSSETRL